LIILVVATLKDPVAGYFDTILAMMGAAVGVGIGLVRVLKGSGDRVAKVVPCDFVVNYILIIAMKTAMESNVHTLRPPIYTSCLGDVYRITNSKN
jgi:uncharacterized membrane protein